MKNNNCNIVRDLMPLVLDRVASDESRGLVEEHITACEECRKQYEEMKAGLPEETRTEYEEEQKTIVTALKEARRKKRRRRLLSVALPVLLSLAVLFGGLMLYGYLFVWDSVAMDNSLYSLSIARLKDGTVDVTVTEPAMITGRSGTHCEECKEGGEQVMYIYFSTTPVSSVQTVPGARYKYSIMSFDNTGDDSVTEIRQGKPDNYVTVWKKGDPIPAASEEMEAFYEYDRNSPYNEDAEEMFEAYDKKLDELQDSVPEWH